MRINELWHSSDQTAWRAEFDRYPLFIKSREEYELVRELEPPEDKPDGVLIPSIERFDRRAWYDFLHDKYFKWKYGSNPLRLTTTRKSLVKYLTDGKLEGLAATTLDAIRANLLALSHREINPNDVKFGLFEADKIMGLGIAGASGLLSLLYPRYFGTVDQFVVKSLLQVEGLSEEPLLRRMKPDSLTLADGLVLIGIMRTKASSLNEAFGGDFWTPRRVDQILWTCGREPRTAKTSPRSEGTDRQSLKSLIMASGTKIQHQSKRTIRRCENCGTSIGDLEVPQLWRDRIVCAACYLRLATSEHKLTPPPLPTAQYFVALKCDNCGATLKVHDKTERIVCLYCGTEIIVPRQTALSDRALRLLIDRPMAWDGRLFGQVLADEIGKCADLKRDVDLEIVAGLGPSPRGIREVGGWISSQFDEVMKILSAICALMDKAFSDAMGPPGTPADPDKLIYAATRIGSQYRALLEWTLDCRRVNVEPEFRKVCNLLSNFVLNDIRKIEDFSNKLQRDLAEAVAAKHVPGEPRTIVAKLKLTGSDMTEFYQEFDRLRNLIG